MHNKKTKMQHINLIGHLIILSISGIVLFFLVSFSNHELGRTATRMLTESAEDKQAEINAEFTRIQTEVLGIAESVSLMEPHRENIQELLSSKQGLYDFESIYYIDKSGEVVAYAGLESQPQEALQEVDVGQVYVSYPYLNENIDAGQSEIETMNLQAAVVSDDKAIGYIYAEYSLDEILVSLESEIEEFGYALFTDTNSVDFFSTEVSFISSSELNNAVFEEISVPVEEIKDDIRSGREGSASFVLSSEHMVSVYKPLNINGWFLVMAVVRDTYVKDIRTLSMVLITSIMIIVALFLSFSFRFWNINQSIKKAAYYDELTGLPNLTKFRLDLAKVLKNNPTKPYSVVKIDINNFKAVNELYDFAVGDKVLCAFADTGKYAKSVEKSHFAARIGGDEFIMCAGNGFLERLSELTSEYESFFKHSVPELFGHRLDFRYGRYNIKPGENDVDDIISKVVIAHGIAKTRPGNDVWDYEDDYRAQILKRVAITNRMEEAMQNGEFIPYLQPKIRLSDNKLMGAEALVRWIGSDGKTIYPNDFIPIFEENGFITRLDRHILEYVCRQLKSWESQGYDVVPISVNFSRLHFSKTDFIDEIIEIVDSHGLNRNLIDVELTETILGKDEKLVLFLLSEISKAGFNVSIDDFGSGYSSLGLLKNLNAHTLKLDRSFFLGTEDTENGNLVIDGIIKLAHNIGLDIVAEGVETADQVEFLKDVDCDSVQGYHYSKPLPIEEFEKKYIKLLSNTPQ